MKTKFKKGDIVEILEINDRDAFKNHKELINKRGIIEKYYTPLIVGYENVDIRIDNTLLPEWNFIAVKIRKVKTLTPKNKKK